MSKLMMTSLPDSIKIAIMDNFCLLILSIILITYAFFVLGIHAVYSQSLVAGINVFFKLGEISEK